ncbi:MAG: prepilin-type N-terminal cleavage/methylation domain-containing protein [Proteobacteria bacterium]|nr:prepilin-type N-terminal cleavage/methylation domain-containing protein [Desulfocapsa sp.]MBU3944862.1 prepilin-type N-terminal cleavage/methylation domain-containing protein [Pseudomonadota bacterium]MBU4029461.1 prepilin-type N-terminal cleavage/methylation domain-containing protein [Pseudomonadota bacterium]MBU4041402.1 prepilin-type N-terminal cleavage/methylation domain-containing protein [Pseudomonadota bacterium]MBU4083864.1 prepilin-type N-terminal cleavage/methylation domain-contain
MRKLSKDSQGFTLVELMIVVAIIGILAAVAIPQYQNFTKKSKSSEAKVMLDSIITAQAAYYAEQDKVTTDLVNDLGDPAQGATYYTYTCAGAAAATTCTATPNAAGTAAGLTSNWVITYDGATSDKTTTYPAQGW